MPTHVSSSLPIKAQTVKLDLAKPFGTDKLTTIANVKHEHVFLVKHEAHSVDASFNNIISFTRSASFGKTHCVFAEYIDPVFEVDSTVAIGNSVGIA